MTPEDQVLFACARQVMLEEHEQAVLKLSQEHHLSWEVVFSKAVQHGIAPLVYFHLCQRSRLDLRIPPHISDSNHKILLRNTILKEQRAQKLAEVLAYFNAKSIEVMLFKGVLLDLMVYKNPGLVMSMDTDLILHRTEPDFSPAERREIMVYLHQSGIEHDYFGHHDMSINGALRIDFARIWRDAGQCDYRGQPVLIMSPEDLFLALCINSCRKRYFKLKPLMDIAETLRVIRDLQWDLMAEKAITYGCQNIVFAALVVTSRILGCQIPADGLAQLRVSKVREAAIRQAVSLLVRFATLPGGESVHRQAPVDIFLVLPYLSYQGYQIRHKLFVEILRERRRA